VEIDANSEPGLVDIENLRNQAQKKRIMRGSVFAKFTSPSVFDPSPAYSAAPATRKACSLNAPIRLAAHWSKSSISRSFR